MEALKKISGLQNLNPVIHEKARLMIMAFLIAQREAVAFTELKSALNLTDGNLNLHMRVLEKNGYARVHKEFVDRRPRTTYELTEKGVKAFQDHVALLERIVKIGRGRAERP